MPRRPKPIAYPFTVSVRFAEQDFHRLAALAKTDRRNMSQTVRLLVEAALQQPR
jgi:hypothetical protein